MESKLVNVEREYAKNEDLKKEDVQSLMAWVDMQPHLPTINELQAIIFLQSCYCSNEAAKKAIDDYFTVKTLCSEIFEMRDPLKSPLKESIEATLMLHLPKQTPEGYTIFFIKLMHPHPDNFNCVGHIRYFDMVSMSHLYCKGTSKGHLILVEFKDMTLGHLAKLGPLLVKKFLYYLQDALPVRLKGLHFVNTTPVVDKLVMIMKPFMKKELLNLLHFHPNVDDLVKTIPRECLPQEYGGKVETMPILHEKLKKELLNNIDLFQWEKTQTVDESKRPGKPKNISDIFGVEGTFKKLEID